MKLSGLLDIPFQTVDQFGGSRQITHGTERIDVGSDRMDDVIDALLDDDGIRTGGWNFVGKTVGSLKTVGVVGDTVVLAQNTRTACRTADHRGMVAPFFDEAQRQIVRPCLCGDGISVADNGMTIFLCQNIDVAKKIEPVCRLGGGKGQRFAVRLVAVGKIAAGQWTCDQHGGLHGSVAVKIQADAERLTGRYRKGECVARGGCTRCQCDGTAAVKGNIAYGACRKRAGKGNLPGEIGITHSHRCPVDGDRFLSAVVVEREAECASGKRCIDRIAKRQIFCVALRMMFCDGHGIAPHGDPLCIIHKFVLFSLLFTGKEYKSIFLRYYSGSEGIFPVDLFFFSILAIMSACG